MKIAALTIRTISVIVSGLCLLSTSLAQTAAQQQGGPPIPGGTVRKAGGVLQGSATRRVTPTYPPLAKAARVSGTVVVEVTVDEEGNVMSARAVSGHPLLKDASVAAARGWKFNPTTLGGEPVKVIGTITFNFTPPSEEDIERAKEEVLANPNSVDAHIKLGEAYRAMSHYEEAATAFETAVGLDPRSAKAHRALAQAYSQLRRIEDSIKHLKEAISLDPDHLESYIDLGRRYRVLERDEEAIAVYKQALSHNAEWKDSWTIHTEIGYCNLKLGRHQEALESFKQAVAINPSAAASDFGPGAAYRGLFMTYIKLGDKPSALAVYETVKGINPVLADQLLEQINKMP